MHRNIAIAAIPSVTVENSGVEGVVEGEVLGEGLADGEVGVGDGGGKVKAKIAKAVVSVLVPDTEEPLPTYSVANPPASTPLDCWQEIRSEKAVELYEQLRIFDAKI